MKKVNTKRTAGERVALYAGSFDPLTHGHVDIIERAASLCDILIVGVGEAAGKNPLLTQAERVDLLEAVCKSLPHVRVRAFSGLAVDFAHEEGASILVRGLRSTTDYTYEVQMAQMNRALAKDLETVFLPTRPDLAHLSSSLAKEIAKHGGNLSLLVPSQVSKILKGKFK